jgi:glycopeptide antibiotics resistance protein
MEPIREASQEHTVSRTTLALALWTSVILMAGMLPLHNFVGHAHWEYIEWTITPRHWRSRRFYFDVIANIVLFFPLGMLLARRFLGERPGQVLALTALGLVLSMGIELFQVYCHNRHPSPVDLLTNTVGTGLGVLSSKMVFSHWLLNACLPRPHSHPTGS